MGTEAVLTADPAESTSQVEDAASVGGTEAILAGVLAELLGVERVSVDGHFFDELGANSLMMTHFCARVRKRPDLPAVSIKDIYRNPTIKALAAALPALTPAQPTQPPTGSATESGTDWRAESSNPSSGEPTVAVKRVSTPGYILCGALQLLVMLGFTYLGGLILSWGWRWISTGPVLDHVLLGSFSIAGVSFVGSALLNIYLRALAFVVASFLVLTIVPILLKWVLIGRWKTQRIRVWSLSYLRFWLVKSLIRANPLVLFVGTPLYVFYLRALGAKIGRRVVIFSPVVPVCTDLLIIGADTVIRRGCSFTGYRAHAGMVETGAVSIGTNVVIGDATVLDIGTSLGEGAQLGHASSVHQGQLVPAGERWHGCPAQRGEVDFRRVDSARCGVVLRFGYALLQLLKVVVFPPLALALAVVILLWGPQLTKIPQLVPLLGPVPVSFTSALFYRNVGIVWAGLLGASVLLGLLLLAVVPRVLNLTTRPGKVYRLYGPHYMLHRTVGRMTNLAFFTYLFGDSSFIVRYLRWVGYDLSNVVQTGSNFGLEVAHDNPYLSSVGSGTMVSDGLSMLNADYSNTSFKVSQVSIGARNFLGNYIVYPAGGRTGEDCLLATKVAIPLDGQIRSGVGLLGSPCFEIPRSVERDSRFDHLIAGDGLRRRLAAKNRHNAVTMAAYLLTRWIFGFGVALIALAILPLYQRFGASVIAVALLAVLVFTVTYFVLVERAATAFRGVHPLFCSIYQRSFWRHERFWKLSSTNLGAFNGTPFKNLIWRMLGVRIGHRVFDDGCVIPEKTLVTIGDDATLNAASRIWGHSQEDGTFKSDHITIGSGVTLGVGAFVHYGVGMGDGAVLETDAFLMKGEQVSADTRWGGNPAVELPQGQVATPAPGAATTPSAIPSQRLKELIPSARASAQNVTPVPVPSAVPAPVGLVPTQSNGDQAVAPPPAPAPPTTAGDRSTSQAPAAAPAPRLAATEPSELARSVRPWVRGGLPGPRSAELLARQQRRGPWATGQPARLPFVIAEAAGSFVRDLDRNVFLDCWTGAGALALGHNHPELAQRGEQLGHFASGFAATTPAESACTEAEISMLPEPMRDRMRVHFCPPSALGAPSALRAAQSLCRSATGRKDIVRVYPVMDQTGARPRSQPPGCQDQCLDVLEQAADRGGREGEKGAATLPAAVLISMTQRVGGAVPARRQFVQRARALTRELNIPLVVDEVATGGGRTGTWFAFEQYDIEPDVIISSRMFNGIDFPLAMVLHDKALPPKSVAPATEAEAGETAPGNGESGDQLTFLADAQLIDIVRREDLLSNVRARGEQLEARLAGLRQHPAVLEVAGRGLMWGVELVAPGDGRSAAELARQVRVGALREGLIVELGGPARTVVRILPPLNLNAAELDFAASILLHAIEGAFLTPPRRTDPAPDRAARNGNGS